MQEIHLPLLRCPISRSELRLQILTTAARSFNTGNKTIITEGILYASEDWFYPIIDGVPRLIVEAYREYAGFLSAHMPDYSQRRVSLEDKFPGLLQHVIDKNRRTRESFSLEWSYYDYDRDKTWDAGRSELLARFLEETGETLNSIKGKLIFDAGCGNGLLDQCIAEAGATVLAMDFSNSIERANKKNREEHTIYIQGDIELPPLAYSRFDIVHCSGVLTHTATPELAWHSIQRCVKDGGKLSTWMYHPRQDRLHNFFNRLRRMTSRWPLRLTLLFLQTVMLPLSFIAKRLKGNRQNRREMMIDLLDWFTPQYRWEIEHDVAGSWFSRLGYDAVKVTTSNIWGFNIVGTKKGN